MSSAITLFNRPHTTSSSFSQKLCPYPVQFRRHSELYVGIANFPIQPVSRPKFNQFFSAPQSAYSQIS